MRHAPIALALLAVACSSPSRAPRDDVRANVTPQRPTLSSDTNTAAEGVVELETGLAWDPGDVVDVPISLRAGVAPGTELFMNLSAFSVTELPGQDAHGHGDPEFGVRHRVRDDPEGLSTAVLASVKLPVADRREGLSSGEVDAFVGGIATAPVGPVTVLGFYRVGALGERRGGIDVEHAAALNVGYGITPRLGSYVELAGRFIHEQGIDDVFLIAGMNYVLDNGTLLDWGVQTGLSDDAAHTRALLGWTTRVGRWKE